MGLFKPIWTQGKILPSILEYILEGAVTHQSDDEQSDDVETWEEDSDLSEFEHEEESDTRRCNNNKNTDHDRI